MHIYILARIGSGRASKNDGRLLIHAVTVCFQAVPIWYIPIAIAKLHKKMLTCFIFASFIFISAGQSWIDICPAYNVSNPTANIECYLWAESPVPLNDLSTIIAGDPCQLASNCIIYIIPFSLNYANPNANLSLCCPAFTDITNLADCIIDNLISNPGNCGFAVFLLSNVYIPASFNSLTITTAPQIQSQLNLNEIATFFITPNSFYTKSNQGSCNLFLVERADITFSNIEFSMSPDCYSGPASLIAPQTITPLVPIIYAPKTAGTLTLLNVQTQYAIATVLVTPSSANPILLNFTNVQTTPVSSSLPSGYYPSFQWNGNLASWAAIIIGANGVLQNTASSLIIGGNIIGLQPGYTSPYLTINPLLYGCTPEPPGADPCVKIKKTNQIIEGVLGSVFGIGILIAILKIRKFYVHRHIEVRSLL